MNLWSNVFKISKPQRYKFASMESVTEKSADGRSYPEIEDIYKEALVNVWCRSSSASTVTINSSLLALNKDTNTYTNSCYHNACRLKRNLESSATCSEPSSCAAQNTTNNNSESSSLVCTDNSAGYHSTPTYKQQDNLHNDFQLETKRPQLSPTSLNNISDKCETASASKTSVSKTYSNNCSNELTDINNKPQLDPIITTNRSDQSVHYFLLESLDDKVLSNKSNSSSILIQYQISNDGKYKDNVNDSVSTRFKDTSSPLEKGIIESNDIQAQIKLCNTQSVSLDEDGYQSSVMSAVLKTPKVKSKKTSVNVKIKKYVNKIINLRLFRTQTCSNDLKNISNKLQVQPIILTMDDKVPNNESILNSLLIAHECLSSNENKQDENDNVSTTGNSPIEKAIIKSKAELSYGKNSSPETYTIDEDKAQTNSTDTKVYTTQEAVSNHSPALSLNKLEIKSEKTQSVSLDEDGNQSSVMSAVLKTPKVKSKKTSVNAKIKKYVNNIIKRRHFRTQSCSNDLENITLTNKTDQCIHDKLSDTLDDEIPNNEPVSNSLLVRNKYLSNDENKDIGNDNVSTTEKRIIIKSDDVEIQEMSHGNDSSLKTKIIDKDEAQINSKDTKICTTQSASIEGVSEHSSALSLKKSKVKSKKTSVNAKIQKYVNKIINLRHFRTQTCSNDFGEINSELQVQPLTLTNKTDRSDDMLSETLENKVLKNESVSNSLLVPYECQSSNDNKDNVNVNVSTTEKSPLENDILKSNDFEMQAKLSLGNDSAPKTIIIDEDQTKSAETKLCTNKSASLEEVVDHMSTLASDLKTSKITSKKTYLNSKINKYINKILELKHFRTQNTCNELTITRKSLNMTETEDTEEMSDAQKERYYAEVAPSTLYEMDRQSNTFYVAVKRSYIDDNAVVAIIGNVIELGDWNPYLAEPLKEVKAPTENAAIFHRFYKTTFNFVESSTREIEFRYVIMQKRPFDIDNDSNPEVNKNRDLSLKYWEGGWPRKLDKYKDETLMLFGLYDGVDNVSELESETYSKVSHIGKIPLLSGWLENKSQVKINLFLQLDSIKWSNEGLQHKDSDVWMGSFLSETDTSTCKDSELVFDAQMCQTILLGETKKVTNTQHNFILVKNAKTGCINISFTTFRNCNAPSHLYVLFYFAKTKKTGMFCIPNIIDKITTEKWTESVEIILINYDSPKFVKLGVVKANLFKTQAWPLVEKINTLDTCGPTNFPFKSRPVCIKVPIEKDVEKRSLPNTNNESVSSISQSITKHFIPQETNLVWLNIIASDSVENSLYVDMTNVKNVHKFNKFRDSGIQTRDNKIPLQAVLSNTSVITSFILNLTMPDKPGLISIDTFVNSVLELILDNVVNRWILLTSSDPAICVALTSKQMRLPVGHQLSKSSGVINNLNAALTFCENNYLMVLIVTEQDLKQCPAFLKRAHQSGVLVFIYKNDKDAKSTTDYKTYYGKQRVDGIFLKIDPNL